MRQAKSDSKCRICGHQNAVGALLCAQCGELFLPTTTHAITDSLPNSQPTQITSVTDKHQRTVSLYVQGRTQPITVDNNAHIVLGRRTVSDDVFVTVDLTTADAHKLGVSRRHAVIRLIGEAVMIKDLGSTNGTYVNNTRLIAGQQYALRSGDELRLGKLVLRFMVHFPPPSEY